MTTVPLKDFLKEIPKDRHETIIRFVRQMNQAKEELKRKFGHLLVLEAFYYPVNNDAILWCGKTLGPKGENWDFNRNIGYAFKHKKDAMQFMLIWRDTNLNYQIS